MRIHVKTDVEKLLIAGCGTPLFGVEYTIARKEFGFVVELTKNVWADSDAACGTFQKVLAESVQIFCWQCALKSGLVRLSEQEHAQKEERLSRCETWW